jgi:hypothetical protein
VWDGVTPPDAPVFGVNARVGLEKSAELAGGVGAGGRVMAQPGRDDAVQGLGELAVRQPAGAARQPDLDSIPLGGTVAAVGEA